MNGAESYLSLGSNLGDRIGYLRRSIDFISALRGVEVKSKSAVYETEPVGIIDQPSFLNLAIGVVTNLPPKELLGSLKEIEKSVGRIYRPRWREREIDIDIIFYGNATMESDNLTIPHERAHLRRFVLEPLSEIAPGFEHPVFHKTVKELLFECGDDSGVWFKQALSDATG